MSVADENTTALGSPRKRDSERTRAALLKAALQEFSQNGFGGGRIDRIAKSANVNIRMLYHYFGDKQGLYVAVLESAYADLRIKEGKLNIDTDHPLEGMLKLLEFTFIYFQSNPLFEGLLRAENMMQGKFVSKSRPVPEGAFSLKKTIGELIASGQAQRVFRDDLDPVNVYVTIAALSRFHLGNAYSMSAVLDVNLRDKAWRSERLAHCLQLFEAYLVRPTIASPRRRPPGVRSRMPKE